MRKCFLLLALITSVIAMSCKKNYTCECTGIPYVGTRTYDLGKLSKKNAQTSCDDIFKHLTSNQSVTCGIK